MLLCALLFFIVALIAAGLGFSGISGGAMTVAWFFAVSGVLLAIVFGVIGRRPPE